MASEQVVRLAVSLLISVWMARQLGPEDFGRLASAIAYAALFAIIAKLGADRIVVRTLAEQANDSARGGQYLAAVLTVRYIGAIGAYLLALLIHGITRAPDQWIVVIAATQIVLASTEVLDLRFQANVNARPVVIAKTCAFALASLVKISLLLLSAPLISFVWAAVLDTALVALAQALAYRHRYLERISIRYDQVTNQRLLAESWPEIVAGFGGMMMMRLDQVMVRSLAGPEAAGTFSVAAKLSETWYFVPAAIVASTFPGLVSAKASSPVRYKAGLQNLMTSVVGLSYLVVAVTSVCAYPVIRVLYSDEYSESAHILVVQIWCGLFMSLGIASGSWIVAERRIQLNLYRNLCGASANIVLNVFLIRAYGAIGAAYATLISMAIAYLLFDFISMPLRPIGVMKLRALALHLSR